jgi:hypothetical protein
MHVIGQPGTDKAPCHVTGLTEGDWDASLKEVVRLYYLDRPYRNSILGAAARDHIVTNLFTLQGRPPADSYPFWECGYKDDHHTGSPQDRADERAWYDAPFFETLGDILKWLLAFILVNVALAALGSAALAAHGAVAEVVAIAATAVPAYVLGFAQIPETENHLLMMNTSRYLINKELIAGLSDEDDRTPFENDQKAVKEWLIDRLRKIAKEDFLEYNSKPYQAYSIPALLNLHDFAGDADLETAARIVLEFASAKFAAGSAQGRRIVPYRRLMETVEDDFYGAGGDRNPRGLFDSSQGSDFYITQMLFFAGANRHLPIAPTPTAPVPLQERRLAPIAAASGMMYVATSRYSPHPVILDVAINKPAFDQTIRHDGAEIYSAAPSFLISAGGIRTEASGALQFPAEITFPIEISRCTDRGAALPTVFLPAAGKPRTVLSDFLRIEGPYFEYDREAKICLGGNFKSNRPDGEADKPKEDRLLTWSHDYNLCVWRGFACGTNIVVPADMATSCLSGVSGLPATWQFFDSSACEGYKGGPDKYYLVIYREPCSETSERCVNNWGFFHAVDNPQRTFDDFKKDVASWNTLSLPYDSEKQTGTYNNGQTRIEFATAANQDNSDDWGIKSVGFIKQKGLDDWPLASGGFIDASGDGVIRICKPGGSVVLELDLAEGLSQKYNLRLL